MSANSVTVEAIFENGLLRPMQPLPLVAHQKVTITVQFQADECSWPNDVAAIYQEIAEEDRRLAATMSNGVRQTWPADQEQS
jgi:predicted DNA-binding antitoxin AbrB/MazE fold protein